MDLPPRMAGVGVPRGGDRLVRGLPQRRRRRVLGAGGVAGPYPVGSATGRLVRVSVRTGIGLTELKTYSWAESATYERDLSDQTDEDDVDWDEAMESGTGDAAWQRMQGA